MHYRSSTPDFDRTIEGFHTGEHLANARRQADARKLDEVLIVDVDCHHYETDNFRGDPRIYRGSRDQADRYQHVRLQGPERRADGPAGLSGRRRPGVALHGTQHEAIPKTAQPREVEQTLPLDERAQRRLRLPVSDPMLFSGLHPQHEVGGRAGARLQQVADGYGARRRNPRVRSMLYLPFNDPGGEPIKMVQEYRPQARRDRLHGGLGTRYKGRSTTTHS